MPFSKNLYDAGSYIAPTAAQLKERERVVPPRNTDVFFRTARDVNNLLVEPFVERSYFLVDEELEYARGGSDPGKILIFNQEFFDDPNLDTRKSSRRDVNEIIVCFQRLGFNINEDDIQTDSTIGKIETKLESVLADKESLAKANCIIIFFLSHGFSNDQLCVKDGMINCSDIWKKFKDCTELNNKPKMFVFQACKGQYYTTTDGNISPQYNSKPSESDLINIDTFTVNQLGANMLLLYSTVEGNVSFRHPVRGTWFIQELCKNFCSYGRRDDVVSLITRLIKCVSGNYYNYDDDKSTEEMKQMPIFVSTLSKKFYLNRNKDRHLLLEISQKQDKIYEMLKGMVNHMPE